jgi:hypothetical protein
VRLDERQGIWECRYFVENVGAELTRERLERLLGGAEGPFADEDVYIVGRNHDANVKLRQRTRTLKVKVCIERTGDGLELWVTTADWPLPPSRDAWEDALGRLGLDPDARCLARLLAAGGSIEDVCRSEHELTCVSTSKRRLFFAEEGARVELADVVARDRRFTSVSFESFELARARELREAVGLADVGEPESYVSMVARFRAGPGSHRG